MTAPGWRERWEKALRSLNAEPAPDWRSRVVHHGVRALAVLVVAALLPALFPRQPLPQFAHLEEGTVADRDVIAEFSFPVPKSPERLAAERAEAEASVAPIFTFVPAAADSSARLVRELFAALDTADASAEPLAALRRTADGFGIPVSEEQARHLADPGNRTRLLRLLERAFQTLLPRGVAPTADLADVTASRIVLRRGERDRLVSRDSIITAGVFYSRAAELAPDELSVPGLQLYQTVLVHFLTPTLRLDRDATRMAREQARAAVETVAGRVLDGERIVAAHERVGSAEMEKVRAYQAALVRRGMGGRGSGFLPGLGALLYGLVPLSILAASLLLFRTGVYRDLRGYLIVTGLVLLTMAGASAVSGAGGAAALVPVAFAALLVGALYDGLLALLTVAVVAVLVAGQPPFGGLTAFFLTLGGGSAAALGVRGVRRRADSWILIAVITGGYLAAAAALTLMRSLPAGDLLTLVGWGGANATICTVFAMGAVLPALESLTGITTDQTLIELSDLDRPLLRRLSREAPGTYAHSINVANLAETACAAIGANPLLARVGVYYHDIGKMERPQFFIENQPKGRNPHDRLPPSRSAEVIREHVRAGLRMAEDARLPPVIKDFIREHHGTMKISYFLEKAREEDPELEAHPGEFAYPGPKPRTKETAVVMLADGVESVARTLGDPTPEAVAEVIDRITRERVEDGQLDECPLTLGDLDRVKAQFDRVLTGMYHRRVEYPRAPEEAEAAAR